LNTNDKVDLAVIDTYISSEHQEILDYTGVNKDVFKTANSYPYESYLILRRNLTNIFRTKELFVARIGAVTGFGFLVGSLFYRRPVTDVGITERVAYLVFSIAFFCYTSLESLPIFLAEREIFQREYSRGAYRALSYVTAVTLVYLPFLLVLTVVFCVISYYLVLLPNNADTFFFDIFALFCTNIAAQSFAVLISVLVPDPMAGQSAGAGLFSVMFLLSGFFIKKANIPPWWIWLHYMSIFKYAYESLSINVLAHKIETDTSTNSEILIRFSLQDISRWQGIGVLLGWAIFYRMIFYYVLLKNFNGRRKD
jgi:ABC-type multidrug transport system permease subunit